MSTGPNGVSNISAASSSKGMGATGAVDKAMDKGISDDASRKLLSDAKVDEKSFPKGGVKLEDGSQVKTYQDAVDKVSDAFQNGGQDAAAKIASQIGAAIAQAGDEKQAGQGEQGGNAGGSKGAEGSKGNGGSSQAQGSGDSGGGSPTQAGGSIGSPQDLADAMTEDDLGEDELTNLLQNLMNKFGGDKGKVQDFINQSKSQLSADLKSGKIDQAKFDQGMKNLTALESKLNSNQADSTPTSVSSAMENNNRAVPA